MYLITVNPEVQVFHPYPSQNLSVRLLVTKITEGSISEVPSQKFLQFRFAQEKVHEESDCVLGDKSDVTQDDLKEMVYLEQVRTCLYI